VTQPTPIIVGAGLAGLIAAHAWPQAQVLEAAARPRAGHRALLRFRTEAVGRLTGIEFRRVTVRKGIWAENDFRTPSIRWANLYAQKVLGDNRIVGERSIWKLDTVERFIAPDNLYEQLIESVGARIHWNTQAAFGTGQLLVSTAPLPVTLRALDIAAPTEFPRAGIRVTRWRVPGADVFQTVYFPERCLGVYRASITGDTLIAESTTALDEADTDEIGRAFGLRMEECELLEAVEQKYGKIAPIDDAVRKQLLFRLTHEKNIYSLGRFATWRNILLDDVVDDITAIKKLLKANNAYDVRRAAA
jgi:hypothetical protein